MSSRCTKLDKDRMAAVKAAPALSVGRDREFTVITAQPHRCGYESAFPAVDAAVTSLRTDMRRYTAHTPHGVSFVMLGVLGERLDTD